ncbi:MAG: DNA polymerase III subunit beta, partial [Planctomycetaceae bacterium]|nr:DNA polymerase III subunit beta [Planctomycetaceae bacterium]
GTVLFQCQDITLYSKLLYGRFPKWREIIPKMEGNVPAMITCGELLSAALKAQLATDNDHPGIQFTFDGDRLTLQGQGRQTGVAEIELDNVYCEQPKTLLLDAKFMTSFLRVLSADTVLSMYLPPDNDPVKITADGDGYTYIVMPMSE